MSFWFIGILVLAVMLVNGWTDAPNAIATVVASGTISFRKAVILASVCDFLGSVSMAFLCPTVAETIFEMADFGGDSAAALAALQGALLAIVLWSTLAWRFGIPTSESHALLAGVTGACVALHGDLHGVSLAAWIKVLLGLLISTLCGALVGRWMARQLRPCRLSQTQLRLGQLCGAGLTAFFHGAQDGQKFMALFLLCRALARGDASRLFTVSLPIAVLCSGSMALGTAIGGRRIIDTVTRDMPALTPKNGLAADLAGGVCLLICSVFGLPVSTTHTKVSAIWGAGLSDARAVGSLTSVKQIIFTWFATFPGCFLLAWALTHIMLPK